MDNPIWQIPRRSALATQSDGCVQSSQSLMVVVTAFLIQPLGYPSSGLPYALRIPVSLIGEQMFFASPSV